MPVPPRDVKFDLLSLEEKAYLLGLYLTDGCTRRKKGVPSGVAFFLGRDEEELAQKVAGIFRRLGLNPKVHLPNGRGWRCIVLDVSGKGLFPTFPDKSRFVSKCLGNTDVKKWLSEEGFEGELGIPFIAGLLDGDGCLRVSYRKVGSFGSVIKDWFFSQRTCPFLIDYLTKYLNLFLATPDRATITRDKKTGVRIVTISASSREALLEKNIANFSFKVVKWNEKLELLTTKLHDLKAKFCTTTQLAKRLQVDRTTVHLWCGKGCVKYMRIGFEVENKDRYWRVIPVEEAERVALIVEKERERGRKRIRPNTLIEDNSLP
jgi:hypothetical protein